MVSQVWGMTTAERYP